MPKDAVFSFKVLKKSYNLILFKLLKNSDLLKNAPKKVIKSTKEIS